MDKNILVGTIVGLVFASSLHIWKSEKISQTQKWILIPMFLFPPLQWVALLMVTLYNKYSSRNEELLGNVELNVNSGNDLDQAIDNLVELRVKGIITFEELMKNVRVIEKKKLEKDLLKSKEFEQLKYLLDIGIISNEDFEIKIEQLKETLKNEEAPLIVVEPTKPPSIFYILFNPDFTTRESTFKYIYTLVGILLFLGIMIIFNLYIISPQTTSLLNGENVSSTSQPSNNITDSVPKHIEPIKIDKYIIVYFKAQIPKLLVSETEGMILPDGRLIPDKKNYSVYWEEKLFIDDIVEVKNYSIDIESVLKDAFEIDVDQELKDADNNFYSEVYMKCSDLLEREKLLNVKSRIIKKDVAKYDTYAEASLANRNKMN